MNDAMTALARRAVACPAWRDMPGMRSPEGFRILEVKDGRPFGWFEECKYQFAERFLPDLDDPATLGCLLALVREAWHGTADRHTYTHHRPGAGWQVVCWSADGSWREIPSIQSRLCDTEAEALVAALEAAPRGETWRARRTTTPRR